MTLSRTCSKVRIIGQSSGHRMRNLPFGYDWLIDWAVFNVPFGCVCMCQVVCAIVVGATSSEGLLVIQWERSVCASALHINSYPAQMPAARGSRGQRGDWCMGTFLCWVGCLLHFAWGIVEAKCISATAVCVSVPRCFPTLLCGPGCNLG